MYATKQTEPSLETEHRFQNFIVFEPASSRVNETDILVRGEEVRDYYERILVTLEESQNIKDKILKNRLSKIGQMLDLLVVYDNVIITKFFDRIWRRYSYISNIGELFLDYPTFNQHFPEFKEQKQDLIALRIDEDDEDDVENDDDDLEEKKD